MLKAEYVKRPITGGDPDPDVPESVFPETFRAIAVELRDVNDVDNDSVATPPAPNFDEDPPPEQTPPDLAEEMAILEATETATSRSERSGDPDRGRINTKGGAPVTGRAPGLANTTEGDKPPDDCG